MIKSAHLFFLGCLVILSNSSCNKKSIDYNADVKPIINKNCISCHGGVKKSGGYSLLFKEEAFGKGKSGKVGIVPGDAEASEFYKRIVSNDPEERMPHEKAALSKEEIKILKDWINEGASWDVHWAYIPVEKVEVPEISNKWTKNDIDKFIYSNAEKINLKPSPEASSYDLARRVSLDLIGMPSDSKEKVQFIGEPTEKNYDVFVDSLLSNQAYGEKWASMWLDLARYADTKGYERDGNRNIWRYRDWLIRSFNEDMPYNQFVTEQLAGDLLPNPSEAQYIATAFNRNTMTNDEGGTENEEFRVAAVIDRVNTTWETLLSTTFACVQCHSHPYDPIKHEEYYQFMAFFNNSRDQDTFADYPIFRHFNEEQSSQFNELNNWLKETQDQESLVKFIKTLQPVYYSQDCDSFYNAELSDTKWLAMRNNSYSRLKNVDLSGKKKLLLQFSIGVPGGKWQINLDGPNGIPIAHLNLKTIENKGGWLQTEIDLKETQGVHDLFFTYSNPSLKKPDQNGIVFDWFYFYKGFPQQNSEYYSIFRNLAEAKVEATPIMMENPASFNRRTNVFIKGSWLSPGEEVRPGVPKMVGKWPKGAEANRLGLAQWMTSQDNPLLARTIVNRVWEQLFGRGLVETLEDMGSQGAIPINQPLLDYLSYRFMTDMNWSIKSLIKEIVLSATYRQDSKVNEDQLKNDPENKYLTRATRVRLSAEQIRDQALEVSGMLNRTMYGKPVMPFQPEGIWSSPYNGATWKKSEGADQYRRAIYTFWKRTSPYPSMTTFDAVGREVCVARRISTNTPLQALVILNDSVYLDLASKLAKNSLIKAKGSYLKSIPISYEKAAGKPIDQKRLEILNDFYNNSLRDLRKQKELPMDNQRPEDAALMMVNNVILNLDEVISKS